MVESQHSPQPIGAATWLQRGLALVRIPVLRNGLALIVSSGLTSGLGVLYWVIAARLYPPAVVGANSAWLAAMTLLAGIAEFSLHTAMIRFIPTTGHRTMRLVGYSYLITVSCSLLVAGMYAWVMGATFRLPGMTLDNPTTVVLFMLATAVGCLFVLQDSVLTGLRLTQWVVAENAIFSIVKILLLVVFAQQLPLYGVFGSWFLAMVVLVIPLTLLIFVHFIPQHVRANQLREAIAVRSITHFVGGNWIASLCLLASSWSLPLIVTARLGTVANAYFYLPWTIAASLQLVASNLATAMTVEAASDQERLQVYKRQIIRMAIRIVIPMVLFIELFASYGLQFFGTVYAEAGTTLMRLLALGIVPNIVIATYTGVARVQRNITGLIIVQAALCIGVLSLTTLLITFYGITGVGVAWLTTQTVVAVYLLVWKQFFGSGVASPTEDRSAAA